MRGARIIGGRLVIGVLAALITVGCGRDSEEPTRAVNAYCDVWQSEGQALHDRYLANSTDPLALLLDAFGSLNDLAQFYGHLAEVAPSEIRGDVETVRDAFKDAAENQREILGNPLGTLGKNLTTALSSVGASGRVDTYTSQRCGIPVRSGTAAATTTLPLPTGLPLLQEAINCNGGTVVLHVRQATPTLVVIDVGFPFDIAFDITDETGATKLHTTLRPLTSTGTFRFSVELSAGDTTIRLDSGYNSGNIMAPVCNASITIYPTT